MRVFISSTRRDLEEYRAAVVRAVRGLGLQVSAMEHWGARSEAAVRASLEEVRLSDVLVGLIGWRYGYVPDSQPPGERLSITEMEYHHARGLDKEVLMYLGDESVRDHTLQVLVDPGPERALEHFRARLEVEHVVTYFRLDPAALAERVRRDLMRLMRQRGIADRPDPRRFFMPFARRETLFGRDDTLDDLHRRLASTTGEKDDSPWGASPVVVVSGLGGVGKTQLVVEYAYRFHHSWPGGIIGLSRAKEPSDLRHEIANIARQLQIGRSDESDDTLVLAFAARIRERPAETLLVVDDVERPGALLRHEIVEGIRLDTLGCRLLLTTRRGGLSAPEFSCLPLDGIDQQAALELLLRGIPHLLRAAENNPERQAAKAICAALGWLPLALKLAGAYLSNNSSDVSPSDYLDLLKREGALAATDMAADAGDHAPDGARTTMRASWRRLERSDRPGGDDAQRLLRVAACFPQGSVLPRRRLALASGLALTRAHRGRPSPLSAALKRLTNESFIEILPDECYRLHPLVRQFARGPDAEPDAERRTAVRAEVMRTYVSSLCTPEQIDALWRDRGGVFALLAEYEAARDLEWELNAVEPASDDGVQPAGPAASGGPLSRTLAAWYQCVDREAYTIAKQVAVRGMPPGAFGWQQLRNRARALGLVEVCESAERWLSEQYAQSRWLRLERPIDEDEHGLRRVLRHHRGEVWALAWSPDGRIIASGGRDRLVRLCPWQSEAELAPLVGHGECVTALRWSPDGRTVASAGYDAALHLWTAIGTADGAAGYMKRGGHSDAVSAVAWDPNGRWIATASWDGTILLWSPYTFDPFHSAPLRGHEGSVLTAASSPDGRLLASGGRDGLVVLWRVDAKMAKRIGAILSVQAHVGGVSALAWQPAQGKAGYTLASAGADGAVSLWDIPLLSAAAPTMTLCSTHTVHTSDVHALDWSADGRWLASGGHDGAIVLWAPDGDGGARRRRLPGHAGGVRAVAWNPVPQAYGYVLASAGDDGAVRIWDVARQAGAAGRRNQRPTHHGLAGHANEMNAAAWSSDGALLATGDLKDGSIHVWEAKSGRQLVRLAGHEHGVGALAWQADGHLLASGGGPLDRTVRVCEVATQANKRRTRSDGRAPHSWAVGFHDDGVSAVAWRPGASAVASGGADGLIYIWEVGEQRGRLRQPLRLARQGGEVRALAWSEGGALLASGSSDQRVYLWAMVDAGEEDARPERILKGGSGGTRVLAWSRTHDVLASGGDDGVVRVWRVGGDARELSVAPPMELAGHTDAVLTLAWSEDGSLLVSGGRDGRVCVWAWVTGVLLSVFPCEGAVMALHWPSYGTRLSVCDVAGPPFRPRIYDLTLVSFEEG